MKLTFSSVFEQLFDYLQRKYFFIFYCSCLKDVYFFCFEAIFFTFMKKKIREVVRVSRKYFALNRTTDFVWFSWYLCELYFNWNIFIDKNACVLPFYTDFLRLLNLKTFMNSTKYFLENMMKLLTSLPTWMSVEKFGKVVVEWRSHKSIKKSNHWSNPQQQFSNFLAR